MRITIDQALLLKNPLYIDLRTKEEYRQNHVETAINFEVLTYQERKEVSIMHKNNRIKDAYYKAYSYALPKLQALLDIIKENQTRQIVFYCHAGRSRSTIVHNVFKTLKGHKIYQLMSGYKGYRRFVNAFFKNDLDRFDFHVLHGYSGSGKTSLLSKLSTKGKVVINFADIIHNTGSYFGDIIYSEKSISQKRFEDIVFYKLYYSTQKKVYVESESRRIGNIYIRTELYDKIQAGNHLLINHSIEQRTEHIYNEYVLQNPYFTNDIILKKLEYFIKPLGKSTVEKLKVQIKNKEHKAVIRFLLEQYYDPYYKSAIEKYKPYAKEIHLLQGDYTY